MWKRVKAGDFDRAAEPLVAQGWFKTIVSLMVGLDLTDNEKVRCASCSLTIDARIWWETLEGKYDIETMT